MEMTKIIILILFIPLVVFIMISVLGRFIGYKGTIFISFIFYLISLLLLSIFLYQFYLSAGRSIEEYYLTLGA